LELELARQGGGSGEDEGNAHGDGVDELHSSGLVVDSCFGVCADGWMDGWMDVEVVGVCVCVVLKIVSMAAD